MSQNKGVDTSTGYSSESDSESGSKSNIGKTERYESSQSTKKEPVQMRLDEYLQHVSMAMSPGISQRTTDSSSNDQVENIVMRLKVTIELKNFTNIKDLILELAQVLDETKQYEKKSQICRKIKGMLKDKISEGKITCKWIEECLPSQYKRKYQPDNNNNSMKSELSSLSHSKEYQGQKYGEDNCKKDALKTTEKILIDSWGRQSNLKEESLSSSSNSSTTTITNNSGAKHNN